MRPNLRPNHTARMPTLPRTTQHIARLRPTPGKQVMYTDAGHAGLALRVGARTKQWTYSFRVKRNGSRQTTRMALGAFPEMNITQARVAAEVVATKLRA